MECSVENPPDDYEDHHGVGDDQAAHLAAPGTVSAAGEEKLDAKGRKRHKGRQWVVERTLGWLSKCRAILVRYAKKSCNYLGVVQLACGVLWHRRQCRLEVMR